ncbi:MAG: GcrA family cell cycle regulator [Ancalomicrobiaceae bacterium]|nr:GcrA family cell cycle regulator [Ancalomicrobiaceae bacterium]
MNGSWTDEATEFLLAHYKRDMSAREIAIALDRTKSSVSGRALCLGLCTPGEIGGTAHKRDKTVKLRAPAAGPEQKPTIAELGKMLAEAVPAIRPATPPSPVAAAALAAPLPVAVASVAPPPAANRSVRGGWWVGDYGFGEPLVVDCGLMDLTEKTCRWPLGDPLKEDFHFCGRLNLAGLPYCGAHARAAYRPPGSKPVFEDDEAPPRKRSGLMLRAEAA